MVRSNINLNIASEICQEYKYMDKFHIQLGTEQPIQKKVVVFEQLMGVAVQKVELYSIEIPVTINDTKNTKLTMPIAYGESEFTPFEIAISCSGLQNYVIGNEHADFTVSDCSSRNPSNWYCVQQEHV